MNIKIKTLIFILSVLFITAVNAYPQDTQPVKYSKSITAGVSSALTYPFFFNAMVNGGFRMYKRHKLDNFIASLTDIKAYKRICRDAKAPVDLGLAAGFGINTAPGGKFLLTSAFASVPVWKLHLECQPTVVVPSLKSSFINLNIAYYFNCKEKNHH
ncbi:MAG: hypothetical protein HY738_13050 [Bacteroidia bacterium]|nr:hypothetical protein [Bacteroidia bacterium]